MSVDANNPSAGIASLRTAEVRRSRRQRTLRLWRSLIHSPVGLIGFSIVSLLIILAVIGPFIVPHDPGERNLRARFMPPGYTDATGTYLLGTDQLGRDIYSRMIVGSSVSVLVGVISVAIAGTIGVLVGLVAGFYGGWIDNLLMRIVDGLLSIPFIILVVAISGVLSPGLGTLILILGLTGWVTYARVIRGEVLKAREMEYVLAAYAIGQTRVMVMMRHILPNVISTAIILAASQVGVTILAESSLSFLGLGVRSPTVTWGLMLADGRQYINSAWWMTTFPGIAITITVLGVAFLGDWLRDVLDPNVRGRG
ncbi:ABC transporter permease [Anaerolineae bacterium CFX9]|jgi:peptide/nickel transport system permease protein|nr:ABC transporter permease [Oscillatoria laete-virens]MDL1899509.1 ABC transporter permease [Anaerolineae bacterium CFX9]MDL5055631.1 ABC transporter permease [Oscillatoria laete-virens NRMC-F 0139]